MFDACRDRYACLSAVGEGNRALPAKAKKVIANQDNECLVSLASVWEVAIKTGLGKLKLAMPVQRYVVEHLAANSFNLFEVRIAHIGIVESLPRYHGDPFDRLLIAQALEKELPIMTADPVFADMASSESGRSANALRALMFWISGFSARRR